MADAAVEFKQQLNYADIVRISVGADGFDKLGFDLFYKLELKSGDEWVLAGKAKTAMLCYDYTAQKIAGLPEEAVKKLKLGFVG